MSVTFYPTISCGEFGKYATIPRALLPVSSWAGVALRRSGKVGAIPVPRLHPEMMDVAADCGGFVATLKWGDYKYSPAQYVDWLGAWAQTPSWAATMDYCCENEVTAGKPGIVRERQDKTTAMAYHFWQSYKAVPWVWVPTVQGWTVVDYERHATEMKPLITQMHAYYGSDSFFRVGIGTLCHRASTEMIHTVVHKVNDILDNMPLHLWGVKLGVFQDAIALPESIVSVDSGAWNGMWGHGRDEWKRSPYSQREWCFKVALPRYEAKVHTALNMHKQARMF